MLCSGQRAQERPPASTSPRSRPSSLAKYEAKPFKLVARDKGAIGANHNIVQVVADRKLFRTSPDRGVFARVGSSVSGTASSPSDTPTGFRGSRASAVGMRFRVPAGEIANVAPRLPILEGHQAPAPISSGTPYWRTMLIGIPATLTSHEMANYVHDGCRHPSTMNRSSNSKSSECHSRL